MSLRNNFSPQPTSLGRVAIALLHVLVVGAILATAPQAAVRSVGAMEPEKSEWKPILGDWYYYTAPTGEIWDARDIATFQGKTAATFLLRRAPEQETTEHWRAVLFADGKKMLPLPYNVGGKLKIGVYWYDAIGNEGPFIRLTDHWGEYLVDLRRRTTAVIKRTKGLTFLGELRAGDDKHGSISLSDYGTRLQATAPGGQAAMVVIGPLATEKGKLVGEIHSDGR